MARLPQRSDLRPVPMPANSAGGGGVPAISAGTITQGGRAMGDGLSELGKAGLGIVADMRGQQDEIDDFHTRKRLMDFKLQTEMELEEAKRSMPLGGEGYADTWAKTYRQRAGEFVGPETKHIPESQRVKVDLALKQWETALVGRAKRDELAERDRHTQDGLETTVNAWRSRVEADPTKHDDVQAELGRLIDMAPLSPAQRHVFAKRVREGVAEAAGQAWADRAVSAAGREEAKRILAPHAPDRRAGVVPTDFREAIKASEGFTPTAKWDVRQHSVGYGTRAKFPGETIDKEEAERRLDEELGKAGDIVDRFKPGLPSGTRAALISLTYNAGDAWTKSGLGRAIQDGDTATAKSLFLQYNKAGGEFNQGLAARRQREVAWFDRADQSGPPAPGGEEGYAGPLADLPLAKRRALWARAETAYKKQVDELQGAIRDQMTASEKGVLPPEPWLAAIEPRIRALGDDRTTALYATMLGKAETSARWRQAPPLVTEMHATRLREDLTRNGGTKEQVEFVEHMEKLAKEAKTETANNAIGWANRNGIVIPLNDGQPPADIEPSKRGQWEEMQRKALDLVRQGKSDEAMRTYPGMFEKVELQPLNFSGPDIGKQLDNRMRTAAGVARYYGQPIQAFAANERQLLGNLLKSGGDPMLSAMGQIAAAAERNGVDASMILREVAPKDAPELAMIGHLAAGHGDRMTLSVTAKALAWRHGQGEGFVSTIDKTQSKPTLGEYADVLKTSPTARDSVKALANLVYEYEHRAKGKTDFDQTLYTDIVHRIMGETKDITGVKYGGIGRQGSGWFDGKWSTPTLVPAAVRQDRFDELLAGLRADDLIKAGGQPLDARGQPYAMSQVRGMTWISVGPPGAPPVPGVYTLKVSDDSHGNPVMARGADGNPLVLDLRPVLDDIRKRKPAIFQGYRMGLDFEAPAPDPEVPSYMNRSQAPRPSPEAAAPPRTGVDRRSTMPRNAVREPSP